MPAKRPLSMLRLAGKASTRHRPVNSALGCTNRYGRPVQRPRILGAFLAQSGKVSEERFYEAFAFGDSKELANSLADLVMCGVKLATAGSLWAFEFENKPLPKAGDLSVVTDWDGSPLCVIETINVEVVPFEQVTAEFAATEGEGDGSLESWRLGHTNYFTRECARIGRTFAGTMPVVCEKFKVVFKGPVPSAA